MLRFPPTAIILTARDIEEYQARRDKEVADKKAADKEAADKMAADKKAAGKKKKKKKKKASSSQPQPSPAKNQNQNEDNLNVADCSADSDGNDSVIVTSLNALSVGRSPNSGSKGHSQSPYSPTSLGVPPESSWIAPRQTSRSSTIMDDFYFGGFTESTQGPMSTTPGQESRELPNITTPKDAQSKKRSESSLQMNMEGSPLLTPHGNRTTFSLTPTVASQVAEHNSPGVMFAAPPRRGFHISPRRFRHQSNSFSFDESERASAAYEQDRISSTSTTGSVPRPTERLSLHDELRGSSLQSSRAASDTLPNIPGISILPMEPGDGHRGTMPLHLPPPFSAVPRASSGAQYLPPTSFIQHYEQVLDDTNAMFGDSLLTDGREAAAETDSDILMANPGTPGSDASALPDTSPRGRKNPRKFLRNAADLVASYRNRSPANHRSRSHPSNSTYTSVPVAPCEHHAHRSIRETLTPNSSPLPPREYQVYNDAVSSQLQPQTPEQLPETRHRSRFHPSFTAPLFRTSRTAAILSSPLTNGAHGGHLFTPSRHPTRAGAPHRDIGRSGSPPGLLESGLRGLYGGLENGDDELEWAEGVRADPEIARRWGLRRSNREISERTPSPEPIMYRRGVRR